MAEIRTFSDLYDLLQSEGVWPDAIKAQRPGITLKERVVEVAKAINRALAGVGHTLPEDVRPFNTAYLMEFVALRILNAARFERGALWKSDADVKIAMTLTRYNALVRTGVSDDIVKSLHMYDAERPGDMVSFKELEALQYEEKPKPANPAPPKFSSFVDLWDFLTLKYDKELQRVVESNRGLRFLAVADRIMDVIRDHEALGEFHLYGDLGTREFVYRRIALFFYVRYHDTRKAWENIREDLGDRIANAYKHTFGVTDFKEAYERMLKEMGRNPDPAELLMNKVALNSTYGKTTILLSPEQERQYRLMYPGGPAQNPQQNPQQNPGNSAQINGQEAKENQMQTKIENVTFINGNVADSYSDDAIIALIAQAEAEIKKMEAIENKPKALVKKINDHKDFIEGLVKIVDARGAK